jgi:hypothetical protein
MFPPRGAIAILIAWPARTASGWALASIFRDLGWVSRGFGSAAFFSAVRWLMARLSRRVGGVPRALLVPFRSLGWFGAGQPGARACSRVIAAVIWVAQGAPARSPDHGHALNRLYARQACLPAQSQLYDLELVAR